MLRSHRLQGPLFHPQQDRQLPPPIAQLLQLCQQLYQNGFFFEDATSTELQQSGQILRRFFGMNPAWWLQLAPRPRLQQFLQYISKFQWDSATQQERLLRKIRRTFQQLNQGAHQHQNLRRNVMQVVQGQSSMPLADFLIFLEAYYRMVLRGETLARPQPQAAPPPELEDGELPPGDKKYSIQEVLSMRKQVEERLGQRAFVKAVVTKIAKKRGLPEDDFLHPKTQRQIFQESSKPLNLPDPDEWVE